MLSSHNFFLLVAALRTVAATAARPNFIVFFADDMGYSQPSAVSDKSLFAGDNGTISTPNLDRLADEVSSI